MKALAFDTAAQVAWLGHQRTRGLVEAVFHARAIARGFLNFRETSWPTAAQGPGIEGTTVASATSPRTHVFVMEAFGAVLRLAFEDGYVEVKIAADGEKQLRVAEERLRARIPESKPAVPDDVAIRFWFGGDLMHRRLRVPSWDRIADNYGEATRHALNRLITGFDPELAGQLILWHGPPGTGKTFALRALAREWRQWATAHFIIDPEAFFAPDAGYMPQVVFGSAIPLDLNEGWQLVILEDVGEFLAADARAVAGQGFSRLLNLTDGLVGQGLKVLVIATSNEALGKLHPAISRLR